MPLTLTAAVRETDSTCRAFAAVGLAGSRRGGRPFMEAVDGPKGAVVRFDPTAHATAFRERAQPRSLG